MCSIQQFTEQNTDDQTSRSLRALVSTQVSPPRWGGRTRKRPGGAEAKSDLFAVFSKRFSARSTRKADARPGCNCVHHRFDALLHLLLGKRNHFFSLAREGLLSHQIAPLRMHQVRRGQVAERHIQSRQKAAILQARRSSASIRKGAGSQEVIRLAAFVSPTVASSVCRIKSTAVSPPGRSRVRPPRWGGEW